MISVFKDLLYMKFDDGESNLNENIQEIGMYNE